MSELRFARDAALEVVRFVAGTGAPALRLAVSAENMEVYAHGPQGLRGDWFAARNRVWSTRFVEVDTRAMRTALEGLTKGRVVAGAWVEDELIELSTGEAKVTVRVARCEDLGAHHFWLPTRTCSRISADDVGVRSQRVAAFAAPKMIIDGGEGTDRATLWSVQDDAISLWTSADLAVQNPVEVAATLWVRAAHTMAGRLGAAVMGASVLHDEPMALLAYDSHRRAAVSAKPVDTSDDSTLMVAYRRYTDMLAALRDRGRDAPPRVSCDVAELWAMCDVTRAKMGIKTINMGMIGLVGGIRPAYTNGTFTVTVGMERFTQLLRAMTPGEGVELMPLDGWLWAIGTGDLHRHVWAVKIDSDREETL